MKALHHPAPTAPTANRWAPAALATLLVFSLTFGLNSQAQTSPNTTIGDAAGEAWTTIRLRMDLNTVRRNLDRAVDSPPASFLDRLKLGALRNQAAALEPALKATAEKAEAMANKAARWRTLSKSPSMPPDARRAYELDAAAAGRELAALREQRLRLAEQHQAIVVRIRAMEVSAPAINGQEVDRTQAAVRALQSAAQRLESRGRKH